MNQKYTDVNSAIINQWVSDGWEWGKPIDHETFKKAKENNWSVFLTPTKAVPKDWFCSFAGARILGLASGGGQQMPIFAALGAVCTVLDYSDAQLANEKLVAEREKYHIEIIKADMTKPLPFTDSSFDLFFILCQIVIYKMVFMSGKSVLGYYGRTDFYLQGLIME